MCLVGTALEFRMILHRNEIRMICQFDCFNEMAVRRGSADPHSVCFKFLAVRVVELITVAVTFLDLGAAIE